MWPFSNLVWTAKFTSNAVPPNQGDLYGKHEKFDLCSQTIRLPSGASCQFMSDDVGLLDRTKLEQLELAVSMSPCILAMYMLQNANRIRARDVLNIGSDRREVTKVRLKQRCTELWRLSRR